MYVCMHVYVQGGSGEPVHPEILNLNPGLNLNLNLLNQFEKRGGEDGERTTGSTDYEHNKAISN